MTNEEFITKAKLIHDSKPYDYSETIYNGNNKSVNIVCLLHGEFTPLANDHLSKKAGCPKCAGVKKLTLDEFVTRSNITHKNKFDYSKVIYKNVETRVIIGCPNGHDFKQTPHAHMSGQGCNTCSKTAKKSTEKFIADARAKYGDKFDYSKVDYQDSKIPVTIICPIKGEFQQTPVVHLTCKTGYPLWMINEPSSKEEFVAKSQEAHGLLYDYSKSVYVANKKPIEISCKEHGPFWMLVHNHYKGSGCPTCALGRTESKPEKILKEALQDFNPIKTISVIPGGRELDIYFEQHKLAVEVNGIYFHSDIMEKHKTSHRRKYEDCLSLGIRLMQFTDKEILKREPIVISMIKNGLGISKKLYARKCEVKEVSYEEYTTFFKANHISGSVSSKTAFGLYYEDVLVSCMSFNKPRFSKEAEWEIIRFATVLGHSVVGGASKLFNAFKVRYAPTSVLSYADLRFGTGGVYEKLEFIKTHTSDIGFSYHHGSGTILSRYQAQRHKLPKLLGDKFDESKSAYANMISAGYYKLHDCGNNVYLWKS